MKQIRLATFLLATFLGWSSQGAITGSQVSSEPNLPGQSNAKLSISGIVESAIPLGGSVRVTIPPEATVHQGSLNACGLQGSYVSWTNLTCTTSGQNVTLTLPTTSADGSIGAGELILISIESAFNTPASSADTQSFKLFTYQDALSTVLLDQSSETLIMKVNPSAFRSLSVKQSTGASLVVGDLTRVNVTLTLSIALPQNSSIQVKFPKLNPDAPSSQQRPMVKANALACSGLSQNLNAIVVCTFDASKDKVTIISVNPTALPASTVISFQLAGVYNPITYQASQITVATLTPNLLGTYEQLTQVSSLVPATPAQIDPASVKITATNSTVQEYATFNIDFSTPIPLKAGSSCTLVFDSTDFTFESSRLTSVQGFGLFGSLRTLQYTMDESQRSLKIISGIESYRQANISGRIMVSTVQNPGTTKPTGSFKIYITDSVGEKLAEIESGATYTALPGVVQSQKTSASKFEVNMLTDITLEFTLSHRLSAQNSKITVALANNLGITQASVQPLAGFYANTFQQAKNATSQAFELSSLFLTDLLPGTKLLMKIVGVTNPNSTQLVKGITIKTYDFGYLVDQVADPDFVLYTLKPGLFYSARVIPSQLYVYSQSEVRFELNVADQIPQGGKLKVALPSEVLATSSTKFQGISNIALGALSCTLSTSVTGRQVFTITNGFPQMGKPSNTTVIFSLASLRMPKSTRTTSSFKVWTLDQNDYLINEATELLTLTMQNGANITSMQVSSSSNVVSAPTELRVSFTLPVPLPTSSQLSLTLPPEVTPPDPRTLLCLPDDSLASTIDLRCTINGGLLSIVIVVKGAGGEIGVGQRVGLRIRQALNPSSTKLTSEFELQIKDKEGFLLAQTQLGNQLARFRVGSPAVIKLANLTALDARQMALTTITINLKTETAIPKGGYLILDFDHIYYEFPADRSKVSCTTNLMQRADCTFNRESQIQVNNLFQYGPYPAGQWLSITIDNCRLDVDRKMTLKSWEVTTMTDDGYAIDRITNGLTLSFPCNAPCQTCPGDNPNLCLSCNVWTGSTILFNQKCYSKCPDRYHLSDFNQCQLCQGTCYTCKQDNPKVCLTCNPSSPFPYLDGTRCTDSCPLGQFKNPKGICDACHASCETCLGGLSTQCATCGADMRFLLNGTCYKTCPSGYLEQAGQCMRCSEKCRECQGSPEVCSACKGKQILSLVDNRCVDRCPAGTSIVDSKKNQCRPCDPKCLTCLDKVDFCTSCSKNLLLNVKTGACSGACSTDKRQVSVNGLCVPCSSNCATCINVPDSCLLCSLASGNILYDFKCVSNCPSGYEVYSKTNQCVISGLRCPFGNEVNPQGTGCTLKAQVCEEGFLLNSSKDRCIPEPGHYVPFPLLICCGFLSLIVLASYIKYKETRVASNLIAVWSFIETIGILVEIILGYLMGIYSAFGLSLVGGLFLIGCNLFFCIIYEKQVTADASFKYWSQTHAKAHTCILYLGGTLNFKLFRVIYGRLFARDDFNAAFDDPKAFFKPFTLTSIFGIVTSTLPVMVGSICGLIFLDFGYQLTINSIEMILIETVLVVLQVYEIIKLKPHVIRDLPYYKVEPKLLDASNVYASFPTTNNTNSMKTEQGAGGRGGSDVVMEYYQRRRHLEQLITVMSYEEKGQLEGDTVGEIHSLQRMEGQRVAMKRSFSFSDPRTAIHEDSADEELPNFISEPVSPREKEILQNPNFPGKVWDFRRAIRARDMFDNVYTEVRPRHYFIRNRGPNAQTQTNFAEMFNGIKEDPKELTQRYTNFLSSPKKTNYFSSSEDEDGFAKVYANHLINDVVGHISDNTGTNFFESHQPSLVLSQARISQIPPFTLDSISGDFQVDRERNSIVQKHPEAGYLMDRLGRRVNSRGYLIDENGNIVMYYQQGTPKIVFRQADLDHGELPEPFYTEKQCQKRKRVILNDFTRAAKKNRVDISSDDEGVGDRKQAYLGKRRRLGQSKYSVETTHQGGRGTQMSRMTNESEEDFMNRLMKPMQPKSKEELLRKGRSHLVTSFQGNFPNKGTQQSSAVKSRNHQENTQMQSDTATSQYTNPIKVSSIGLFEQTKHYTQSSIEDIAPFEEEELHQQVMERYRQKNRKETPQKAGSTPLLDFNIARIERLQQMKNLVQKGSTHEDNSLRREFNYLERSNNAFKDARLVPTTSLAKKNLTKIYGKASVMSRPESRQELPPQQDLSFKNVQKRSLPPKPPLANQTSAILREAGDSRLRDLESIYLKTGNSTGQSRNQTQVGFFQRNSTVDSTLFPPKRVKPQQDSDQDLDRVTKDLDKMQRILERDARLTQKLGNPKRVGQTRQLLNGGWI